MKNISTEITIHLNNYAHCFADDMCAFMTGETPHFDEGMPGYDEAENFQNDPNIPSAFKSCFNGYIEQHSDDYGPTHYYVISTPGWYNHGHDGIFEDIPENDEIALKDYKTKTLAYANSHYSGEKLKEEIETINNLKKVNKHLSEQGFVLTINLPLNEQQVAFIKQRAFEFAEKNNIKILSLNMDELTSVSKITKKRKI